MTRNALGIKHLALVTVCLLAVGCGGSGMPTTKIIGRVTFDGGPPPKPGMITYSLVPGTGVKGLPYRPGTSPFGTDGEFTATSFKEGDGLLPGTYKVRVTCLSGPPSGVPLDSVSLVPLDWTPEDLVIQGEEDSVSVVYDVPPKKSTK